MRDTGASMMAAIQISTTVDSEDAARELASRLVDARLAACVQVLGPIVSTYRWENRVETAAEWLCLIKTRADRFPDVEEAIREHHPYDVPEIVACPIVHGSDPYLQWIVDSVMSETT